MSKTESNGTDKLAQQELSLKEKYQSLREKKDVRSAEAEKKSTTCGNEVKSPSNNHSSSDTISRMEAAKKVLRTSLSQQQQQTSGFKRPTRRKNLVSSGQTIEHNSNVDSPHNSTKCHNDYPDPLDDIDDNLQNAKRLRSSYSSENNSPHPHGTPNSSISSPSSSHQHYPSPQPYQSPNKLQSPNHFANNSPHANQQPIPIRSSPPHPSLTQDDSGEEPEFLSSTLFIGDMGDFVDESELGHTFSRFGPIDNIRLIAGKSFAFVKYVDVECAQLAMRAMNGEMFGGARIRVAIARNPNSKLYSPYHKREGFVPGTQPSLNAYAPPGADPRHLENGDAPVEISEQEEAAAAAAHFNGVSLKRDEPVLPPKISQQTLVTSSQHPPRHHNNNHHGPNHRQPPSVPAHIRNQSQDFSIVGKQHTHQPRMPGLDERSKEPPPPAEVVGDRQVTSYEDL